MHRFAGCPLFPSFDPPRISPFSPVFSACGAFTTPELTPALSHAWPALSSSPSLSVPLSTSLVSHPSSDSSDCASSGLGNSLCRNLGKSSSHSSSASVPMSRSRSAPCVHLFVTPRTGISCDTHVITYIAMVPSRFASMRAPTCRVRAILAYSLERPDSGLFFRLCSSSAFTRSVAFFSRHVHWYLLHAASMCSGHAILL